MCLTPYTVKNVNANILSKNTDYAPYYDTASCHILVPCGRCSVCIALKQQYIVQRVQMEEKDNLIFMGMLSYNNKNLPSMQVNGYNIKYADVRDIQDMFRYIRKWENLDDFRYFAISEFGSSDSKSHRPHWHFFFFYPKKYVNRTLFSQISRSDCENLRNRFWKMFLKYWRTNRGTRKNPKWECKLTFKQIGRKRNYDLQWVDTLQDYTGAPFYVSKYVTKTSKYVDRLKSALYFNCSPEDYKKIWSTVKPHMLVSKGFGNPYSESVAKHIRLGIDMALADPLATYPYFISPHNGKVFPLAPYYREKFLTAQDSLVFKERLLKLSETDNISDQPDVQSVFQKEQKLIRFEKVKKLIASRDEDLSKLFNEESLSINNNLLDYANNEPKKLLAEDFELTDDW